MLKNSFWTALSSLAFAISSFITNKIFAISFGPQGVTLLAHFQNLIGIFLAIPSEGINKSVAKTLSNNSLVQKEYNSAISVSILATFLMFILVFILLAIFFPFYKSDFPEHFFTFNKIGIILIGIFLHIVVVYIGNLIFSSSKVILFSIISILNNLFCIAIVWYGSQQSSNISLVYIAFSHTGSLFIFAWFYYIHFKFRINEFKYQFDNQQFKIILQFIISAISALIFGKVADFFVRSYVISTYNLHETGMWQAVVKISDGYSSVFMAAFGTLIFVKFSSLNSNPDLLSGFIRKMLILVMVSVCVLLLILLYLSDFVLMFFYSKEFTSASFLMPYQFLGDVFKFPFLIISNLLLVQMRTKLFVSLQALSAIIYITLIYIYSQFMDINSINLAHSIRWILMFLIIIFVYKDLIFRKLSKMPQSY